MQELKPSILGNAILQKKSTLNKFTYTDRVALLASFSIDGSIKAHVEYYISRLVKNGFRVVLVIACDDISITDKNGDVQSDAEIVILRDNKGFDFGSWAHAFHLFPDLYQARSCLLTNDSLFGPFDSFDKVVSKLFSDNKHDLYGLTQSDEVLPHIQSYFLHLSNRLLRSDSFKYFMESIKPFEGKKQVISLYELPFTLFVQSSGFSVGVMFTASDLDITQYANPTLIAWRKLIQLGFPFFKIQLLYDNHTNVDISEWEEVLRQAGYDEQLAVRYIKSR